MDLPLMVFPSGGSNDFFVRDMHLLSEGTVVVGRKRGRPNQLLLCCIDHNVEVRKPSHPENDIGPAEIKYKKGDSQQSAGINDEIETNEMGNGSSAYTCISGGIHGLRQFVCFCSKETCNMYGESSVDESEPVGSCIWKCGQVRDG